jgi:vancomycin permeability regulator SanA
VGFVRRHPILAVLVVVALVALAVLATTATAVWRAAHTDDARRVDHADVVIVLGAAQYNGRPSPVFEARLRHAILLFNEGFASRILVVGGGKPGDRTTEGQAGRDWLVAQGIPADQAFASPTGSTTYDSLKAAAAFMRRSGLKSAFLVSDPWHNLRIKKMAADVGIKGYASADFRSAARSEWTRLQGYVRETFAYLYYRIFGR